MIYKLIKSCDGSFREAGGIKYTTKMETERMHVIIAELEPGAETEEYIHEGEEFRLVLEGEIECEVEGRIFRLKEGDAIWHLSSRRHKMRNVGGRKAKYITVRTFAKL